ncbi:MAG: hypothetical protein ABFR95_01215, partial [Actinomycetota bacterium]
TWRSTTRRGSLSVALWVFGLATTLLLVGLWGRAVTYDEPTVQASARSVVDAEVATDRIYSWIEEGVATSTDIDPATAETVVSELREHPEVEAAVGAVIDQFIAALFASEGEAATVNLARPLAPVVPIAAEHLSAHDAPVDEADLVAALDNADAIDLATGDAATVARVIDDARTFLSVIVLLAAITLLVTGSLAVWLSNDHLAMARTLATRILLSALSFAVLFRIGSWVLDPRGGGSPVAGGGSILLGSNSHIFLVVALPAAAAVGALAWFLHRRSRRPDRTEEQRPSFEDDTRELVGL